MPKKFDEIVALGREWEEGISGLILDLKNEISDSDDEDFKKILGFLEETYQLLRHFKLATRGDVFWARIRKDGPVFVAGEIIPPPYHGRGDESPTVQDIEKGLSETKKELEEMKDKIKELEDKIDKPKKKSDYLSKGIGYAKDLVALIKEVKDFTNS